MIATAGALVLDLSDFATFLFLLGSFFVPLLGVLLADWLVEGMHYTREKVFDGPAVRPEMIARLARRLRPLPVALAAGAGWWQRPGRPHRPGADRLHRVAPELRRRVPARRRSPALLVRSRRPARRLSPRPSAPYAFRHGRREGIASHPGRRPRRDRPDRRGRAGQPRPHARGRRHDALDQPGHPARVRAAPARRRSRSSSSRSPIYLFVAGREDELAGPCPQRKNWMPALAGLDDRASASSRSLLLAVPARPPRCRTTNPVSQLVGPRQSTDRRRPERSASTGAR